MVDIIWGSGHRPDKLGGYSDQVAARLESLAWCWLAGHRTSVSFVVSGMALGWDQALARASVAARVPFHAYVPFKGQETMWPKASQQAYHDLLAQAARVVYVCEPGFASWKMQRRNQAMVDAGTHGLVLWDGTSGGTRNCLQYADLKQKQYTNLWKEWCDE
jgi:uncharacterized phage-like protein YoqJ